MRWTCEDVSRLREICSFFPCALDLRGSALDSFAVEFWGRISIIFNSPFEYDVKTFVQAYEELVYFICSRTRSPRPWDVILGNSCIWLHLSCWFSSSRDRKRQSYPVEYYLESVEEFSEGKIHKSEHKPGNGHVNTVYFVIQARGNTRISRTEFVYSERARNCKCLLTFELPA